MGFVAAEKGRKSAYAWPGASQNSSLGAVRDSQNSSLGAVRDSQNSSRSGRRFYRELAYLWVRRATDDRSHFLLVTLLLVPLLLGIMEYSYSDTFTNNVIVSLVSLYVLKMIVERFVVSWLGDLLLAYHVMAAYSVVEFVITLGAEADFVLFIIYYVMGLWFEILERVYIDPVAKRFQRHFPLWAESLGNRCRRLMGREPVFDHAAREALEEFNIDDEMLEDVAVYSTNTTALVVAPVVMLYLIVLNAELGITELYGVRPKDLVFYMAFQIVVALSQSSTNVLVHNVMINLWGYRLDEYFDDARRRFVTRTTAWKSHDGTVFPGLDAVAKAFDLTAYSPQLFLVWCLYVHAALFVILGLEMLLRASENYSPFSDTLAPLIAAAAVGITIGVRWVAVNAATKVLGLWGVVPPGGHGTSTSTSTFLGRLFRGLRHRLSLLVTGKGLSSLYPPVPDFDTPVSRGSQTASLLALDFARMPRFSSVVDKDEGFVREVLGREGVWFRRHALQATTPALVGGVDGNGGIDDNGNAVHGSAANVNGSALDANRSVGLDTRMVADPSALGRWTAWDTMEMLVASGAPITMPRSIDGYAPAVSAVDYARKLADGAAMNNSNNRNGNGTNDGNGENYHQDPETDADGRRKKKKKKKKTTSASAQRKVKAEHHMHVRGDTVTYRRKRW